MKAKVISLEPNEKVYVVFGTRRTYWASYEMAERYRKALLENGINVSVCIGSVDVGNEANIEDVSISRDRNWPPDPTIYTDTISDEIEETSTSEESLRSTAYRTSSST